MNTKKMTYKEGFSYKKQILNWLYRLSKDGMEFPGYGDYGVKVKPTSKCISNTEMLLDACSDNDLFQWEVSLYPNGTILLFYVNTKTRRQKVTAMINVAESNVSGVFAYKKEYITVVEDIDKLCRIFDIFKKVKSINIPKVPDTQTLLKVFWMFDKHGLIKDDLCFDPEHFMETVIREHWYDTDERGNNIN